LIYNIVNIDYIPDINDCMYWYIFEKVEKKDTMYQVTNIDTSTKQSNKRNIQN